MFECNDALHTGTNSFFLDLELEMLTVNLDMTFNMTAHDSVPDGDTGSLISIGAVINERFTMSLTIDKMDFEVGLFLALDSDHMGSVTLGQLWENTLDCGVASIFGTDITALYINCSDIRKPTFTDFVSTGIDVLLRSATDAIFAVYKKAFVRILPNLLDGLIRSTLNDAYHGFVSENQDCPAYPKPDAIPNYIDFIYNEV